MNEPNKEPVADPSPRIGFLAHNQAVAMRAALTPGHQRWGREVMRLQQPQAKAAPTIVR
jgi:hypothetical protein